MKREDMTAAAKFTVTCDRCGRKITRSVTTLTAERAMWGHERSHRAADSGGGSA